MDTNINNTNELKRRKYLLEQVLKRKINKGLYNNDFLESEINRLNTEIKKKLNSKKQ